MIVCLFTEGFVWSCICCMWWGIEQIWS